MHRRTSGVLMNISSLSGDYEVGTLGDEAREFIDIISEMGFTYWHLMSVNPTNDSNSPHERTSLFAGNPSLIEPSYLIGEGLLTADEVNKTKLAAGSKSENTIDGMAGKRRLVLLKKAFSRLSNNMMDDVKAFAAKNKSWVYDYALFTILKSEYDNMAWDKWTTFGLRLHKDDAIRDMAMKRDSDIMFWVFVQYIFYKQMASLKKYANERGIYIIGEMPLYASFDSADVWANREMYEINSKLSHKMVTGLPPDYSYKSGRLWGNPLYNWEAMKKDGYAWWLSRLGQALEMYDMIKIHQFSGFYTFWAVPYHNRTAKKGMWKIGPGMDIINRVKEVYKGLPIIAGDLGNDDNESTKFLEEVGYPGIRVMQFGFESKKNEAHLPKNYNEDCVAYTSALDDLTIMNWYNNASEEARSLSLEYCNSAPPTGEKAASDMRVAWIEELWNSKADLVIVPAQELCGHYEEPAVKKPPAPAPATAPAPVPAETKRFRLTNECIGKINKEWMKALNEQSGRAAPNEQAGS